MPLEALALLFDLIGLGAPFWWLTGQTLSLLLGLAHADAETPGAVALLQTMPMAAFALVVAGGPWNCLWKPGWRRRGLIPVAHEFGKAWGREGGGQDGEHMVGAAYIKNKHKKK